MAVTLQLVETLRQAAELEEALGDRQRAELYRTPGRRVARRRARALRPGEGPAARHAGAPDLGPPRQHLGAHERRRAGRRACRGRRARAQRRAAPRRARERRGPRRPLAARRRCPRPRSTSASISRARSRRQASATSTWALLHPWRELLARGSPPGPSTRSRAAPTATPGARTRPSTCCGSWRGSRLRRRASPP